MGLPVSRLKHSQASQLLLLGGGCLIILVAQKLSKCRFNTHRRTKSVQDTERSLDPQRLGALPRGALVPRSVSTGGRHLELEEIVILEQTKDYMVFDKPFDCRLDGESEEPTVERAARHADPSLDKIRFCNQLDYATSGILLMARTRSFAREAGKCFEGRTTIKHYLALGHGHCTREGAFLLTGAIAAIEGDFRMELIEGLAPPPGGYGHHGGHATTIAVCVGHGYVGKQSRPASAFLLRPLTGRRHQLRLHLASEGHAIIGDATYSEFDSEQRCADRMMLHAWRLEIPLKSGTRVFQTPEPFAQHMPGDWPRQLAQALKVADLLAQQTK